MADLGHFALFIAWFLALYGVCTGAWSGARRSSAWFESTRNATIGVAVGLGVSMVALSWAFLTNDYSIQYVWQFSNRDMDPVYKVSAIWGGMDGSMLLWAFMLAVCGALAAWWSRAYPRQMAPWVLSVVNSSNLFFITAVLYFTNPFRAIKANFIPPDGNGLNPLLQNPLMVIHPPTLYAGFTTFSIPFAFCIGALLSGYLSNDWIRLTRRWTLIAWCFLTAGIVLGGHWAYVELGWGGFWAWDPVENSSFFPWLTGTAFLHSVMVQERKNMLKFWNVWLVALTYGLTVFGTFLTRSGIVQSVHAFASTDIGWIFLVYLGAIFGVTAILCFVRRDALASERKIESFFSRESAFLLNNLVLLSICFTTIWGVMWPVISEGVFGEKQSVGIPFFNAVNVPLFLALLFLMGVGPLIAWRQASFSALKRTFGFPFLLGMVVCGVLVWAGVWSFYPVVSYGLCFFVLMTILGEYHRGLKVVKAARGGKDSLVSGIPQLFRRHRSRYGGYFIHFGVLVATVGITASMAHKIEEDFTIAVGDTYRVGRFELSLKEVTDKKFPNYEALIGAVELRQIGSTELISELRPEKRFYFRNQEQTSEVALRVGIREDVYLALAGVDETGTRVSFRVFVNPLQVWLWIGVVLMIGGSIIVLIPNALAREGVLESSGAKEII